MGIYYQGICRGFGSVYIPFKIKEKTAENISVTLKTEKGSDIPFSLHFDQSMQIVTIAAPLLSCKKIHIIVSGSNRFEVLLSLNLIKWISRFNYKFHYDSASRFRDVESDSYFGKIHIRSHVAIEAPGKNELIIKGVICAPLGSDVKDIYLIDGFSEPISNYPIVIGKPSLVRFQGFERNEIPFSIRIPKSYTTYCLVADGSSIGSAGYFSFDPEAVKHILNVNSPLFYKPSSQGVYECLSKQRFRYQSYVHKNDLPSHDQNIKFSIIVPLYKTPIPFLREMIDSVESQFYANWELILVNASPECVDLTAELNRIADSRVKIITINGNLGISENTNIGIRSATGDYIVFFDHDDVLDPFALYRYAEYTDQHSDTDALYCDEDFLNEAGEYVAPHFKSDFNLDLLRVHNYITHLLCVRSSMVKELMLHKEFDGAQDYDFLLRLVEKTHNIHHVREVLYHWRISDTSTAKSSGNKNYADDAGRRALQSHLDRCGLKGTVELSDSPCFYHITYELNADPLVSIVIPNKDSVEVLRRCVDSIEQKTSYRNFEVLIIENNSVEDETFSYYGEVSSTYDNIRIITWEGPFNYSAINNYGVKSTNGEYLLFLNNDTEVIEPGWLSSMLGFCQRNDVGAVGAKLLYPDDTVQHAGVMMIHCNGVNEMGGPIHVFNNLDRDDPGYMRRAVISQDLSAVTAACMMTKRSIFDELNGFNEDFEVAFNDVDYCLRVRALDKLVVFDADALLYHYESFSRGYETGEKRARFMREQGKLRTAWAEYYVNGDPYHSPMSTR